MDARTGGGEQIGLTGCRLVRPKPVDDQVEIAVADAAQRSFPARVSDSLGICLKRGPAHDVTADGRRMGYPADAISVRPPGCVWSSGAGVHGFVSVDISARVVGDAGIDGSMAFLPRRALPGFTTQVRSLAAADSALEADEIVAGLVSAVLDAGVLTADVPRERGHGSRAVDRARDFLHAHLAGRPTLDETAEAVGVNKFMLLRYFRRTLDTTPHAYLVMLRTRRAQQLLARGVPLIEAAFEAGFSDQAHMGRWFKRAHGITPAAYVRQTRSAQAS